MDEPKSNLPTANQSKSELPPADPVVTGTSTAAGVKVIKPLSDNLTAQQANTAVNPFAQSTENPSQAPVISPDVPTSNEATTSAPMETLTPAAPGSALTQPPEQTFITGSQIVEVRKKLPFGVYLIASLNLLAFAVSFFDTSQTGNIYSIAMLVDLLFGVGMLLRMEWARKIYVWLSVVVIILSILSIFVLIGLQLRIKDIKANYNDSLSKIDQTHQTASQKKTLDTLQAQITDTEKKVGKLITFAYIKNIGTAVGTMVIVIYLTRPKVKEVFVKALD